MIADDISNKLVGLEALDQRSTTEPVDQESKRTQVLVVEESILTLMRVADRLGFYEEVNRRIGIPERLKESYWKIILRRSADTSYRQSARNLP